MITYYVVADAAQAHLDNKHERNGFAADWMECATTRCREARVALRIDLERCPTCHRSLSNTGQWIHAEKEQAG